MPSADFCPVTETLADLGAVVKPPQAGQISPDKNMNCHSTTAAFTLSREPVGFVTLC